MDTFGALNLFNRDLSLREGVLSSTPDKQEELRFVDPNYSEEVVANKVFEESFRSQIHSFVKICCALGLVCAITCRYAVCNLYHLYMSFQFALYLPLHNLNPSKG